MMDADVYGRRRDLREAEELRGARHWDPVKRLAVMEPCSPDNSVAPDADAMEALQKMSRTERWRPHVVEDEGRLVYQ